MTYKEKYESKQYPECYVPCPPFYDVCNSSVECIECIACCQKFKFEDSIE